MKSIEPQDNPARADSRPLRVGIVGAGKMGLHHATAVARLPELARVVAVADPSSAARNAMLARSPGAATFATIEELLARSDVDVVHVCTAPQTHAALAATALQAGRHVYVEKPFAESTAAAEALIALAASRGLKICPGHQLLYEAPARRALELLPALGALSHVESFFSFRPVRRSADGGAALRADLQLLDILPHPIYLLLEVLAVASPDAETELSALELGPAGSVHALVRRGNVVASLVVTLEGRPVESYLRLVGRNGTVHADFVRGTVQRLLGPGSSGIDKALNPFRLSRQLATGTVAALGSRVIKKQRSYPGLAEIFEAFYNAIRLDAPSPIPPQRILETVRVWETIAAGLAAQTAALPPVSQPAGALRVAVTGGTGFLGVEVVRALKARGAAVRALARRTPPAWDRVAEVEYRAANLAQPLPEDLLRDVDVVIHCAAETAGGWDEHQRNSLDATEHLVRAAAAAQVRRVIHVSSLAVLAEANGRGAISEQSPLEPRSRGCGPYVWGKLESERLALELGRELGLEVKVVRPGALVDYENFDPPGRLGKRLGNIFVAVGARGEPLGVADVRFAARTLAWMALHFTEAPDSLNVLSPTLPTKRDLVGHLKRSNPDLTVVWLPRLLLAPLSWLALGAQKVLRPGTPAIDVAKVFARQRYDTSRIRSHAAAIESAAGARAPVREEAIAVVSSAARGNRRE